MYLVTGGSTISPVTYEIILFLAQKNATVYVFCGSNTDAVETLIDQIIQLSSNSRIFYVNCDCTLQSDIRRAWEDFLHHQETTAALIEPPPASSTGVVEVSKSVRLDAIIYSDSEVLKELSWTVEGVEATIAANLIGPYLLVTLALPVMQSTSGSRVVVVSGGGKGESTDDWMNDLLGS